MKMNNFFSFGNKALRAAQAGFTMIELLVVIAVIGVLSVAVLSSINPIEQINKGRDTRARSDAAQLINAVDRYFSIAEEYPWNTVTDDYTATVTGPGAYADPFVFSEGDPGSSTAPGGWGWTQILVDNSEVKSGFVNRLESDENVSYHVEKADGANATMYVCFVPSSNAFETEAADFCEAANFSSDFPESVACAPDCADDSSCMICLP